MANPEKPMTAKEWHWLGLLANDEAQKYPGNHEHVAKFRALADKCFTRSRALLDGVVMP